MTESNHQRGGLLAWFAGNSVTANLLMIILMVGGFSVAVRLNAMTFPDVDPRQIAVSVPYRGATPEEVEESITRRVEEAVIGIEGVDRVRSNASEGSGLVTIDLKDFADAQKMKDDIETAVDQLANFPPEDAEQPSVTISEASADVMTLAVYGELAEEDLRAAAERVEADLLDLRDVSLVELQGAREREISIEVSEDALRRFGLSLDAVSNAVRAASVDLSGGTLRTTGGEILLRTDEERRDGRAFEDIVVASDPVGRTLFIRDLAVVRDAFEDDQLINTYRGQSAIFVVIGRSDDQDAFDISAAIKTMLGEYAPPTGVSVEIVDDSTTVIGDRLSLLARNAVLGLALVFLFLTIALDLRLAFWTTLGIPISFLGGFLIFGQIVTLNMVTLFALIVVLGIVVDDAIVVGENIFEAQEREGPGRDAAVSGVMGVVAPVTIGVMTTMAAFAPLMFSSGTLGQIMFPVPVVVIAVLAISLVEAFFILPAHLSHGRDWSVGAMARVRQAGQSALARFRDRVVMPIVVLATRARYATLGLGFAALIVTWATVSTGTIRFVFFPSVESDQVRASLEMREGAAFDETRIAMEKIVAGAYSAVGGESSALYQSLSVTAGGRLGGGGGPPGTSAGTQLASNIGEATLTLAPAGERDTSSEEIAKRWREAVGDLPGVKSLSFNASLIGAGADVSVDLVHEDDAALESAVESLEAALRGMNGVGEIESGLDRGKRQLSFKLTPAGAAAGLTTNDIARQVRQAFFGEEVQRIQRGREEVLVYVRYPADQRRSVASLERLRIRLAGGGEAPLGVVADIVESVSPTTIERVDGRRVVSIEASVDDTITTPSAVNAILASEILPRIAAETPRLRYSFEGTTRDQSEDLGTLANNLYIAVGIIFILLASVLRSYTKPLIIMAAIPFAASSAVWGHLLMGYDLSFLSLFGVVALTGVVINDSVVLLDYDNKLREQGFNAYDAAIASVRRRFRPILLTTLTTFLGLAPMLAETSLQARFLIPMAISLGFGILFTGFIIFVLVPSLLMIGDDISRGLARVSGRLAAPGPAE